jgi:hypothetical protein
MTLSPLVATPWWIGRLYETTRISGQTAEQYVSTVNRSYETQGLQPQGKPRNSHALFHDMRKALDGFTNARLLGGGPEPAQHEPTLDSVIESLCRLIVRRLSSSNVPLVAWPLQEARWPTSGSISKSSVPQCAMLWPGPEVLSSGRISTVKRRLMDGRKNKRAPTHVTGEPCPHLHPISLL